MEELQLLSSVCFAPFIFHDDAPNSLLEVTPELGFTALNAIGELIHSRPLVSHFNPTQLPHGDRHGLYLCIHNYCTKVPVSSSGGPLVVLGGPK